MKKIHYILSGLAAVAMAASCTLNKLEEPVARDRGGKTEVSFTAYAPGAEGTKTMVSEAGPDILWQNEDRILIFFDQEMHEFITYLDNPAPKAVFKGSVSGFSGSIEEQGAGSRSFWAVYPFDWQRTSRDGESVTVSVPSRQTAVAGSYDPRALVMVAQSYDLQLGFYNVCGGLKFKLAKEGIQQVEFKANGDLPLAGSVKVSMDKDGFPVSALVQERNDAESSIVLTAPYGESFKANEWYYLTCLPAVLSQGWTLIFRSGTETGVLEHPVPAEVKRSVWGVLENADSGATFTPANNVIWNEIHYTTTDGNIISPRNIRLFNDEKTNVIISNTYENGLGRMVFEEPITIIPNSAFYNQGTLETIVLPASVREIGSNAFRSDNSLKDVQLSEGVISIGKYAFSWDPLLERVTVPASLKELGRMAFSQSPSLASFGDAITIDGGRCLVLDDSVAAFAPAGVKEYTMAAGVKRISYDAFAYNQELESIVLPDGVEEIDTQAFYQCSALQSIQLPGSLRKIGGWAFSWAKLSSLDIPEGVTILSNYVATYCSELKTVTLPSTLTELGEGVFCGDSALEAIYGPLASADHRLLVQDGVIKAVAPYGLTELTVPGSIQVIGMGTFAGLTGLKKITLENGVHTIGDEAFYGSQDLEEVSVPETVTIIGNSVFSGCNNLRAFSGGRASADGRCLMMEGGLLFGFAPAGITEYAIPEGVTRIGPAAFSGCGQLTSITIPDTVVRIEDNAFRECNNLTNVSLPEGLEEIGDGAFSWCQTLPRISIPSTVIRIGNEAFYYCSNLSDLTLVKGLQEVGEYAFYNCGLTNLMLPASVNSIGAYSFACPNLQRVKLLPTTPPRCNSWMFDERAIQEIIVPLESLEAYKTTEPWSWFGNRYKADMNQESQAEGVGEEDWN